MTEKRVFRYEVPVDDQWHAIRCTQPLKVECREVDTVEFWAFSTDVRSLPVRRFRVFGTGQAIEDEVDYVGTAVAPGGSLVWHLMEQR